MNRKRYKYIHRLVEKITTSPSNNMEFNCYGHLVHLESETDCYVSVAVYHTTDRYSGELADFSFDYWTHELYVEYAEDERLFDAIVRAFRDIYASRGFSVSRCEDEEEV